MQSPAKGTESVPKQSCTGLKYQCDECDVVLFVQFEPERQRSDVVIANHYKAEHEELANQRGGHDGATYVGFGAPDWGTEEGA